MECSSFLMTRFEDVNKDYSKTVLSYSKIYSKDVELKSEYQVDCESFLGLDSIIENVDFACTFSNLKDNFAHIVLSMSHF